MSLMVYEKAHVNLAKLSMLIPLQINFTISYNLLDHEQTLFHYLHAAN
jgi:hypothetical protein